MNFDQIFPQVKQRFAIKLNLLSPKKKYDFIHDCEGINIRETFNQAVRKFNDNPKREIDGGLITEYEIRQSTIFLALEIYKDEYKKIKNMIGNAFSKPLYSKYGWKKLTNKKLFKVEVKQLEDKNVPEFADGVKVNTLEQKKSEPKKTPVQPEVKEKKKKEETKTKESKKEKAKADKKEKK